MAADNAAATKDLEVMLCVISCFLLNFWPQLCAAIDSDSHRSMDQVDVIVDLTVSDSQEPWPSPALRVDLEASSLAEAFMPVPVARALRPPETRAKPERQIVGSEAWPGQRAIGQE